MSDLYCEGVQRDSGMAVSCLVALEDIVIK
jgi:hypothetical protein